MCDFFSTVSNGKGKVLFFKIEDIQRIEKEGNKENYNYNSHTSILHYYGIKGVKEDSWNKWEYDPETKTLSLDGKLKTKKDDKAEVESIIQEYLKDNGEMYCFNLYKKNSGYRNSGNCNSGNCNSGDRNSGDWNSGDCNSGNCNSGYRNSGYRNSGDCNSGDCNSGDWNSGYRNSGFFNTDEAYLRMFNKETKLKRKDVNLPSWMYFDLTEWVEDTTKTEGGYLKKYDYKEAFINAFNKADVEGVKQTLELPNFDYKIFEEISGISKKMIEDKLNNEN